MVEMDEGNNTSAAALEGWQEQVWVKYGISKETAKATTFGLMRATYISPLRVSWGGKLQVFSQALHLHSSVVVHDGTASKQDNKKKNIQAQAGSLPKIWTRSSVGRWEQPILCISPLKADNRQHSCSGIFSP